MEISAHDWFVLQGLPTISDVRHLLMGAVLVVHDAGCAAKTSPFPTAKELDAIAAKPAPPPPKFELIRPVQRWLLAEPAPTALGTTPHEADSAAGALLAAKFAGKSSVVRSGGLACVAREYGRFWLKHQARPAPELETFIQARCGEPISSVQIQMRGSTEPGAGTLSGPWRGYAEHLLSEVKESPSLAIGMWSGEADGRSVAIVAYGLRVIKLEPIALDAGADGQIELRGQYVFGSGSADVFVTRGTYGYDTCDAVPGATAPQFHFRCAVDPNDPTVLVEMMYAPPDWVLGVRAMIGLVAPGKPAPLDFATPGLMAATSPMPLRDGTAMLSAINDVRRRVGVMPLGEVRTQSGVAARMLPHYLAASNGGDLETMQKIALGMMAGWEVHELGLIRSGDFSSMHLFDVNNMQAALGSLLMTPAFRALLLDPEAEAIALATKDHENGALTAAMVSTYRFFRGFDDEREAAKLLDRLDAERAALGKPRVIRVQGGNSEKPLKRARTEIKDGRKPENALQEVLDDLHYEVKIPMRGLLIEGFELMKLGFPAELLHADVLQIDIDVDYYQPKGSPWGRFFVLVVYAY